MSIILRHFLIWLSILYTDECLVENKLFVWLRSSEPFLTMGQPRPLIEFIHCWAFYNIDYNNRLMIIGRFLSMLTRNVFASGINSATGGSPGFVCTMPLYYLQVSALPWLWQLVDTMSKAPLSFKSEVFPYFSFLLLQCWRLKKLFDVYLWKSEFLSKILEASKEVKNWCIGVLCLQSTNSIN